MIQSAMPIHLDFIVKRWLSFVEVNSDVSDTAGLFDMDEKKTYHFCASLAIEALQSIGMMKGVKGLECTANDVVVYATPHIKLVNEPELKKPTNADSGLPGVVRSRNWV
jgi:hypothetical protein